MAAPRGVGAFLAEAGDLTVARLSRASAWQKKYGGTIERALLATGAITEQVLTAALSQVYGLPGVSRDRLAASDPGVVASLPAGERRRLRALPFERSGKRLKVATCDPRNSILRKKLAAATGCEVEFHVAPGPVLEDLFAGFDGRAFTVASSGVRTRLHPSRETPSFAPLPKADPSCRHKKTIHFALCPHCGDVL